MTMRELVRMLSVGAIAFWVGCSSTQVTGTSEQGNARVVCAVTTENGVPVAGAVVRLRNADYLAAAPVLTKTSRGLIDTVTDAQGRFSLAGINAGSYAIEVIDIPIRKGVLLHCQVGEDDSVNLGTHALDSLASITGVVDTTMYASGRIVQIYGLERSVVVGSSGRYTINDLPAGVLRIRITSSDTVAVRPIIIDSVITTAGSTTVLPLEGWKHAKKLIINTAASGAGIVGDVVNFPLLIRLDSLNFDFSQARDAGQDLRLTKADGTLLPFEIELWDAVARAAAIWVLLDTVFGNSAQQFLMMHYGNQAVSALSNSNATFDTSAGFVGVWHMNRNATGIFADATPLQNAGGGAVSASGREGVCGEGQQFDGVDDAIDCGNSSYFALTNNFTLCAWVKLVRPVVARYNRIISKKTNFIDAAGFELVCNPDTVTGPTATPDLMINGYQSSYAEGNVTWDSSWHLCAVVVRNNVAHLFVDGVETTSAPGTFAAIVADQNVPLFIGGKANNDFLEGSLDEVRLERAPRSADWIKLSFENQRPGSLIVNVR